MDNNNRSFNLRIAWLVCLAVVGLCGLQSCATPPPTKSIYKSNYKSNLSTRLDISVNYHGNDDTGIVVVDISNPRAYDYRYWLVQLSETDGQRISAARRFYHGNKKKHQEVFKVPGALEGVTENFYVEVFDNKGALIMKSEPIINLPKGGQP